MYSQEITETSKSALLELGIALHMYQNDMVLAGGWAPYFITEGDFEHCGSIDIDLVLKTTIMPKYNSIRKIVTYLGYGEENLFRFKKEIKSPVDGRYYSIHIDFLCDKCDLGYHFSVQPDLQAFMFEGADIAFDFNFPKEIETTLPENGVDRTVFHVLNIVGSLTLKGQALGNRRNLKDAYDIFALTHFNGGPEHAAIFFTENFNRAILSDKTKDFVKNSLSIIRQKFRDSTSSGSFSVETFSEGRYNRTIVAAQVNSFLQRIGPVS